MSLVNMASFEGGWGGGGGKKRRRMSHGYYCVSHTVVDVAVSANESFSL